MTDKKLLQRLIDEWKKTDSGTDQADFMARRLAEIEDLKRSLWSIHQRKEDAEKKHDTVQSTLDKELHTLQKRCLHESTHHTSDPAGGTDSHTTCNICEKEL